MTDLSKLTNSSYNRINIQRVGRGPGSGRGKTSSRGHKGAKSRSGYKRRYGYEGGQFRLFAKLPKRGFTRGRHLRPVYTLNLGQFDKFFKDGEIISLDILQERGIAPATAIGGLKILAKGELTIKPKKIIAQAISAAAVKQLEKSKISFEILKLEPKTVKAV